MTSGSISRTRLCFALVSCVPPSALAQTPLGTDFTYQGQLKVAGDPADGLHDLRFALYDASVGGTQVGPTVCIDDEPVTDGLFTVALDFGAQFAGQGRFLQIDVRVNTGLGCGNATGFVALSPRQALTAAPHSLFATNAGQLDGLDSSAFLQSVPMPLTLSGTSASHIIRGENAATTFAAMGVVGVTSGAVGTTYGVYGRSDSTSGFGVFGTATAASGFTTGGHFVCASTDGYGVTGQALATSGLNYGGHFKTQSPEGYGVFGWASATSGVTHAVSGRCDSPDGYGVRGVSAGTGVAGQSLATSGLGIGVSGYSESPSGIGVYGFAVPGVGLGAGGYFESASNSGRGVVGRATANTAGLTHGVWGETASTGGRGVLGYASAATGLTYGGYFQSDSANGVGLFATGVVYAGQFRTAGTAGRAVQGEATAVSGVAYGGYFETSSSDGIGVRGLATSASGNTTGGYFTSEATNGIGVFGRANAGSGTTEGVLGWSSSTSGIGVSGRASANSGFAAGGSFTTDSPDGYGVLANNNASLIQARLATGSYAVYGSNPSFLGDAAAIYGIISSTSPGSYSAGVHGQNNGTGATGVGLRGRQNGSGYGVYGSVGNVAGGYAGYFDGRLTATGTKSFQIDHPLDPENKYLNHFCAEGSEPLNMYSGNVTTDASGEVWVELPPYFEDINRDFRYALTIVDENDFALARVSRKIQNNRFAIKTNRPHVEVSWRVEGVRNDRWVRAYGAPIEPEKPAENRGKYLHPELYGQPKETGQFYEPEQPQTLPPADRASE